MDRLTCVAPINIAVIKYWGKSNEDLNIPVNSSLSVTIHPEDLCTTSTICVHQDIQEDEVWLNGKKEDVAKSVRIQRCLNTVRKHSSDQRKCKVASVNNFPTAAGLASSASGYACLAACLREMYKSDVDVSMVARLGSGSACRSVYGGFVKWEMGTSPDGSDSKAVQIADENHWSELKVVILVASNKQKSVGSTEGMRRSVETSELLNFRCQHIVPKRMEEMEKAILEKDFETFALLTMKDSNQFHCICQDTYPPICPPYMNDISHKIVNLVSVYNKEEVKAAYTFDAGANAVLFCLQHNYEQLLGTVLKYFPHNSLDSNYINMSRDEVEAIAVKGLEMGGVHPTPGGLERIICTKPGPGAYVSDDATPLLDTNGEMV
jgi:diphosphomevalonate decarboxylase